jgi:two-component system NtrC family sensor kinase
LAGIALQLPKASRSALGLLRFLLACSVVIPLLLFAGASWLDYRATFADAERDLTQRSEVAREQAERLFDGQSQVVERVSDLVRGMDVAAIRHAEEPLHEGFGRIVAHLPDVQSVLLVSADGRPLVSAGTYPVPDVDLRPRDYFKAVVGGYSGTYVSSLQLGGVNHQVFFGLARPWIGADGKVAGVIDVAVLPSFFEDFYKVLIEEAPNGTKGNILVLLRDDGQVLVRYPPIPTDAAAPRMPEDSLFLQAIRAHPEQGLYKSRSVVAPGAPLRLMAYHKVAGYPLYVVAGRTRRAIIGVWQQQMESHLVFGVPAAIALFAVTWTALVRTRREEAALARANQENEMRQHAEEALLRAQRLEAVGQMTGGVAHDFNNLLTIIMGGADMLTRRSDDPAYVRRVAEQITLAARRGGEVTQQLLAFSRRQFAKPETVNLNRRLMEFEPLLRRAAREAVTVTLDLDPALDPVRLDPGHFEAAILNLVGNARDAMPGGGGVVIATRNTRLDAGDDLPPGRYVRVAVSDTGIGMDRETVAKAFEPFFTTKDVGQGSGLGLSQVFGFARQAGGDVRITSEPGRGTTVEILLPPTTERPPNDRACTDSVPLRNANAGEVVLVVEDEPAVLALTVESLRDLGYATMTATSAQAALDLLRGGWRVDLLFSDVVMPGGMNGLQLSVEARRLRPDLKVLLTSGYTAGIETTSAEEIPLLTKPYDRSQLASQLRAVLQG